MFERFGYSGSNDCAFTTVSMVYMLAIYLSCFSLGLSFCSILYMDLEI